MSELPIEIEEKALEIEVVGSYKPSPKGFGFIMVDNEKVLMVNYGMLKKTPLFNGDVVKATAIFDTESQRYKTKTIEILDTPKREIMGTAIEVEGILQFMPEIPFLQPFGLTNEENTVKEGDRLKARAEPLEKNHWTAKVIKNLGQLSTKNIDSALAMTEYNIPSTYSEETLASIPETIEKGLNSASEQKNRKDYTNLPFVTIDSESTRDIDDAIYVEPKKDGTHRLYVAIADVAEIVKPNTVIDKEAFEKGTSVYFIQGTVPMLPHALSEGACSLLPGKKRPVLIAEMDIDKNGDISNINISQAWITSHHRLSYNQVTEALSSNKRTKWMPQTKALKEVYEHLLSARIKRGALPIRSGDYHHHLDDKGKIVSIEKSTWHIAYGLVEECMLAANTAVAKWMMDNDLPGIYRHHTGPDLDAWGDKKEFFEALGIEVSDTPSIFELNALTETHKDALHGAALESTIRSTMKAATYVADKTSHYSLAYDWYTHFTSPIRRYSDRTIHRIVKAKLNNEPIPSLDEIVSIAERCTECDKRARQATRAEEKKLMVQYAAQYVGHTTNAQISGGTKALIFLKDDALMIEGGCKLPKGWTWNKKLSHLVSDAGHSIILGSDLPITLNNVDTLKWKIEYKSYLDLVYTPPAKIYTHENQDIPSTDTSIAI